MNPFDIKSALLAKHAQHVVLIHFPIALFLAGAGFDIAAWWTKQVTRKTALAEAAYFNLLAAAVSVIPALATGVLAWQWQLAGKRLTGTLLSHLVVGCVAGSLMCLVAWIHVRNRKACGSAPPVYRLALELLAALVVVLTAHIGGFLSGVNLGGPF